MKKIILLLAFAIICLSGCSLETETVEQLSAKYNIGDEVKLGDVSFNIYKIDDTNNELYLMAQNTIATTKFSSYDNDYEGSFVETYVNEFVDTLENQGLIIKSSGIIEQEDLYELGFDHSGGLSGRPYRYSDDSPEFITYTDNFWVGGYCKYDTYSWVYSHKYLDTYKCEDEYGVRPIIVIAPSEIDKSLEDSLDN